MKRQNEGMDALVYAYGARVPLDDPHLQEEARKQRAFWDALVEADRAAEWALDDRMKAESPEYAAAVRDLITAAEAVREVIERRNAERAQTRTRATSVDAEVKERITARNAARKAVWKRAAEWRKANKDAQTEHQDALKAEFKRLRQQSGLYWANYNRVIDSFQRARQQTRKLGRRVHPSDPARDDGIVAVQIQRTGSGLGAAPEELHAGKVSQLRIDPPPVGVEFLPANRRKREARVTVQMRVDAAGHMIEFPLVMHRPLPAGARVKQAQLVWRQEGERWRGKLCLTLSSPHTEQAHSSTAACGVDLGWRLEADGALRVATVMGSDGRLAVYRLPAEWMTGMGQVERLSEHLSTHAVEVGTWLHSPEAPEDLRAYAAQWSPKRSASYIDQSGLHDAVRARHFDVPAPVLHWYKRYRHLLLWRDNLRMKLLKRRQEVYRLLAVELASRYAVLGIEDMDLAKMAKTKKRDDASDPELQAAARSQRQRAAVHTLRSEIEHQAHKRGATIVHETANTTSTCGACGQVTGQADRSRLIWTCEHCSAVWDQDHNAAGNLLAAAVGSSAPAMEHRGSMKSTRYDLVQPQFREVSKMPRKRAA